MYPVILNPNTIKERILKKESKGISEIHHLKADCCLVTNSRPSLLQPYEL